MLYWLKVHLRGFIMVLHLVWLIPAAIFALLCYREPRSLFNAYLLHSYNDGNCFSRAYDC